MTELLTPEILFYLGLTTYLVKIIVDVIRLAIVSKEYPDFLPPLLAFLIGVPITLVLMLFFDKPLTLHNLAVAIIVSLLSTPLAIATTEMQKKVVTAKAENDAKST